MSPAVPKCQFSALTMHKKVLQKFLKGKWTYDQAELADIIYWGRQKWEKQTVSKPKLPKGPAAEKKVEGVSVVPHSGGSAKPMQR